MMPVEILIIGAGSRGNTYGDYAVHYPEQVRVIGVAEPRAFYRERMCQKHGITAENAVTDWRELAARPKFADAVVVATPDALHLEPARAFARLGYDMLLEKPLAPDPVSCQQIVDVAREQHILLAVGHVLRYTAYTQHLKAIVESGVLGEIVSVQHLEPVGYWHMAHSFVRGNWRNEAAASCMLLQKSCHDLDWLRYIIGQPCIQVSSFGSLMHFRKEQKPIEAGEAVRCLDCVYEKQCPYSAKKLYVGLLEKDQRGWPLDVVTTDFTQEGVIACLKEGPYGRCVYECDNDVVDHQIVNLLYANGVTASFSMVGTSAMRDRQTTIFGTRGELRGDGEKIIVEDYLSGEQHESEIPQPESGHGGGDHGLMERFVAAVARRDPSLILSGPEESLETHLTVFAAEQGRREQRVISVRAG